MVAKECRGWSIFGNHKAPKLVKFRLSKPNIAVRATDLVEAWQESGQDFITVRFYANLLDYTTDETGTLIDGNRTEPVKFEEFWTFSRPVGTGAWKLSAISQS